MYVNSIKFDHKLYLDYGPVILIPTGNEVRNITNRARTTWSESVGAFVVDHEVAPYF